MPLLVVAVILGLLTSFVKPVLKLLSFPFIIVTLGLFLLVINAALLLLAGADRRAARRRLPGHRLLALGGARLDRDHRGDLDRRRRARPRRAPRPLMADLPALPTLPPARTPGRYTVELVCLGNICRSPTAHVVLEDRLAPPGRRSTGRCEVQPGTGGWHVGEPMDARAAATLTRRRLRPHAGTAPASTTPRPPSRRPGAGHGRRQPGRPWPTADGGRARPARLFARPRPRSTPAPTSPTPTTAAPTASPRCWPWSSGPRDALVAAARRPSVPGRRSGTP